MDPNKLKPKGLISSVVEKFLTGYASWILILVAIVAGLSAVWVTPREEEPQIVVPLADVHVYYPGASAKEVEYLVANPLEKLLWQIDGVEYVYSMSRRDRAIVTVRFYVGEDRERSLIKLYNKLQSNIDQVSPGIQGWVVKPIEIDDVPIVNMTLYSKKYDSYALRRMGEDVLGRLEAIPDISRTQIIGGLSRQVRIELNMEKMAGMGLSPLEIYQILARQNSSMSAGQFAQNNKRITVYSGPFLTDLNELRRLVVGLHQGKPVYLEEVARVIDGPEEEKNYVRIGFGSASDVKDHPESLPAVTLALSKKKGTNAVAVANQIIQKMKEIQSQYLPGEVEVAVTRNYGETANHKVNELISGLFFAIVTVVLLLILTMGWREAIIVSTAVPISFGLALLVNYLFGYTINRVTLFALILSLGLVVDDPITNMDNIQRHIFRKDGRNAFLSTLFGVQEVLPPVMMATLAIIVSFLPLFFISGMMGPYMGPMAINVPLAMIFSLLCSLTIVPWMAYNLLKNRKEAIEAMIAPAEGEKEDSKSPSKETRVMKIYRTLISPFLNSRPLSYLFLLGIVFLLFLSAFLALTGRVPLKMLPFDNKNEFQIVVDMPEGTTLEQTDGALRAYEKYLKTLPEMTNYVSYVGLSSPIDFNGMVRHYYLRQGTHIADIRVNLAYKENRSQQSHAILLRIRKDLEAIAQEYQADIKLVEVPPGPPVISTLVAEVTGTPDKNYDELIEGARLVKERMKKEYRVVDVDWMAEDTIDRYQFHLDKVKASLNGIDSALVVQSLKLALSGLSPGTVHLLQERHPLNIQLILPRKDRSSLEGLSALQVKGKTGYLVSLGEIGKFVRQKTDQPIYHKNLIPVVYVIGEMAGRAPAEAVLNLQSHFSKNPLPQGLTINWAGEGEWKITLDVFRDLGIAFGVAMIGIYLLLVMETTSLFMPLLIMMAIPLTAIGIMPGFYLLNLVSNVPVGGFDNPVFFTATGMIGMIALGGIVVRNAIVLIEFIQNGIKEGLPLKEALLESGGVRFRPIVLTAGTTALGAWPITLDPVFSGLAWSLIFGIVASTIFTLFVVPLVFWMIYGRKEALALAGAGTASAPPEEGKTSEREKLSEESKESEDEKSSKENYESEDEKVSEKPLE